MSHSVVASPAPLSLAVPVIVVVPVISSVEEGQKGSVKIIKSAEALADGTVILQGIQFELIPDDPNLDRVFFPLTDAKGETAAVVPVGTWTLRETSTPVYYDKLSDQKVTVNASSTVTLSQDQVYNRLTRRKVQIMKVDGDSKKPVPGASFRVLDMCGNPVTFAPEQGYLDPDDETVYITACRIASQNTPPRANCTMTPQIPHCAKIRHMPGMARGLNVLR